MRLKTIAGIKLSSQRCEMIDYELMRRQTMRVQKNNSKRAKAETAIQMIRMVSCEFIKNGAILYEKLNVIQRSMTG